MTGLCRTGKTAYPAETIAAAALAEIVADAERMAPGRKIPVRAYECTYCAEWHLTSKTKPERSRRA